MKTIIAVLALALMAGCTSYNKEYTINAEKDSGLYIGSIGVEAKSGDATLKNRPDIMPGWKLPSPGIPGIPGLTD